MVDPIVSEKVHPLAISNTYWILPCLQELTKVDEVEAFFRKHTQRPVHHLLQGYALALVIILGSFVDRSRRRFRTLKILPRRRSLRANALSLPLGYASSKNCESLQATPSCKDFERYIPSRTENPRLISDPDESCIRGIRRTGPRDQSTAVDRQGAVLEETRH